MRDDDYDVLVWTSGHNGHIRSTAHGYELTRKAAMTAFAKSWRRS